MSVRKPVVAGQFYESDSSRLKSQVASCFLSKFGPGSLPSKKKSGKVFGCIAPHAGFVFSGPGSAFCYKALAESKFPSTFVIIGPNHSGYGSEFATLFDDWETPLGTVKVDKDFVKKLMKECDFLVDDASAHIVEHSVEVQLPFLQFISGNKTLKFVPIVVSSHDVELFETLGRAIASVDRDVCVIASSDFTHYGLGYGYLPFTDKRKERMYELDKKAISHILSLDVPGFVSHIKKFDATICGFAPIIITMFAVKSLGCKKGELLNYYTSGDVLKDYSSAVGYASIIFR
ncbi:MAG: AmmeMemoRadiSam system protein B [archaeon]